MKDHKDAELLKNIWESIANEERYFAALHAMGFKLKIICR